MRLPIMLINLALIATVSGCSNIPFMNDIPLWAEDPAKLDQLGKGATVADVDKAFGRSRVLWAKSTETTEAPVLFRLYDSVESTVVTGSNMVCRPFNGCSISYQQQSNTVPYAVVFVGAEPKLHMWGTLSQLRDSGDAAVVAMLPELSFHYNEYRRSRR
jgi:hypothetical protein